MSIKVILKYSPTTAIFVFPSSLHCQFSPILPVKPPLRKGHHHLCRKSIPAATFFLSLLFSSTISFLPPGDLISTENSTFFSTENSTVFSTEKPTTFLVIYFGDFRFSAYPRLESAQIEIRVNFGGKLKVFLWVQSGKNFAVSNRYLRSTLLSPSINIFKKSRYFVH
jgi:hypothetical protein